MKNEVASHLALWQGKITQGDINVYTKEGPQMIYQRAQVFLYHKRFNTFYMASRVTLVYMYTSMV